jgi:hypothetical protein
MIFVSHSPRRLCLTALALLSPLAALTLAGCSGSSNSSSSSVVTVGPLAVTGISPTSGPAGTTVTITGTGFVNVTEVRFGTTDATSYSVVSSTEITAVAPAFALVAPHIPATENITVVTSNGTSATSAVDVFSYAAPPAPAVSAISPTSGTAAGGTAVTITGSGFLPGSTVQFGANAATNVTFVSSTQLTATSPAGSAGAVDVTVTDTNGTSISNPSDQFTYASAAPTITSFTPTSGLDGETVTITGTNFTGATAVTFNGFSETFTVVSSTEITATIIGNPGPGSITAPIVVTTPSGTATSSTDYSDLGIPFIK